MAAHEFELIDIFTHAFERLPSPVGPGDDCAVLPPSKRATCVTTDVCIEGVHFSRPAFSFADIGHKALAVNLSDLAAMGATPQWALCSLAVPDELTATHLKQLGRGMAALARLHGVKLIGGNFSRSPVLSVSLTVGGALHQTPMLRSTARVGDTLWVSGTLGDAAAGLWCIDHQQRAPSLVNAQKRPAPHVEFGKWVAPFASSCIDVSDGLLQDVGHLAQASGVGFAIDSTAVPRSAALQKHFSPLAQLEFALAGGEDYVLAFTVPEARRQRFEAELTRSRFSAFAVGTAEKKRGLRIDGDRVVGPTGHQHR